MRVAGLFGLVMSGSMALGLASCASPMAACMQDETHVTLVSAQGEHCFEVEIADSPEERRRGLMDVRHMDRDRGMLFLFEEVEDQSFWMKNTYISLDIIFIGPDGRVVNIAQRTQPLSEESIPSYGPVSAVLEINGGLSEKLGLKAGDQVRHPALGEGRTP